MLKHLKTACLLLALLTLVACSGKKEVVMPLQEFTPVFPVQEIWSTQTGKGVKKEYLKLSPALVGNQIYTSSYSGRVTAIDASTGRVIWQVNTKQNLTTGVSVDGGAVYVGTEKGQVLALSRSNGAKLWSTLLSNEILANPNAQSPYVLVKSIDDHLYALNKQTGQPVWNYKEETPSLILRGGQSPKVAGNLVVVGFANGQVGVFSIANGEMLWKHAVAEASGLSIVDQMVDINDTLAVAGNTIYVATYQGNLSALGLRSGELLWQHDISSYAGLAIDDRNVYVTDASSKVWAFSRRSGQVVWEQDKLMGRGVTGPQVMGNAVVVADSKGYVHWLSADNGSFVARTLADKSGVLDTPYVQGNSVFVYTNNGKLIKYRI
ncbi:MAG TPA: outer membrane protein assembly factor BamB [Gammaproteobacteria bacterium]|nr:outer membrane protein assembly factor BamB [Gammaproteobacteria bacterium]